MKAAETKIVAIHLCKAHRASITSCHEALSQANIGLKGDRHARPPSKRQIVLMEAEVLEELGLKPGDVRENITTSGMLLMKMTRGQQLQIGASGAVLKVTGPCEPCYPMDGIRPDQKKVLERRRRVTARVITSDSVRIGDAVLVSVPTPKRVS